MPITTVAVTCTAARPDGSLIAGGKFRFLLSSTDTENGLVVPREISATANAQGVAVANLWPNSLGALGTQYRVLLSDPLGSTIDLGSCTVPTSACNLHAILGLGTAPTLDQATVAKLAAQTAAAASSTSATQSASSATQAATSATAAAGSATAAAASQTAAAGSVTSAANSATAAGNSATSAASSNTAAGASATSAASSAADALSSKNAAATSATSAASSATAAQTSATNAATSATTATTKASEAATSASNAATSATAALASQNAAATSETNAQGSATTAATQASNAASSATNAASSASSAASSLAAVAAVTTGNMSSQNANAVAVTGGAISGTSITVKDNVFTLQDEADPTKQAQFQLSGINTGTTYTYTLPNSSGILAGTNIAQNWTSAQTFAAGSNTLGSSAGVTTTGVGSGATTTGNTKAVNIGTGGLSGSTTNITVGSANGSTTTMLGSTVIGGAAGNQSLQVNNVASAVNYAQIVGAATTGYPLISAQGADTNIALNILAKGTGDVFVGGSSTVPSLKVSLVASQVNSFQIYGQATGQSPTLACIGSDTNIGLTFQSKGTGAITFNGNGQQSFNISTASGSDFTNYYNTAGDLNYTAAGGSTNINFAFASKGAGAFNFATSGGRQAAITHTASAVNYLQLTGAATGAAPTLSAQGSDADISLVMSPKGTGVTRFTKPIYMQRTYGTGSLIGLGGNTAYSVGANASGFDNDSVIDSTKTSSYASYSTYLSTAAAGFTLFALRHYSAQFFQLGAGSAVTNQYGFFTDNSLIGATNNYGFFSGITAAAGRFNFYANGTAANVFVGQTSLGGTVGAEALRAVNTASAVNYVQALGAITTGAPELSAQGSDANINLKLTPKGTGVLQFGTYTAGALSPTGYITITDAGGTSRRLLVG